MTKKVPSSFQNSQKDFNDINLSKKEENSKDGRPNIPDEHPRSQSLHYRHALVDGMFEKVVTPSGLIAHGRGEAYDYIMGEKTSLSAEKAIKASVASLLLAEHPIISVNGNVAALVPNEIVKLSSETGATMEINLFYREEGRLEAIEKVLRDAGAKKILGLGDVEPKKLNNLKSNRRIVDPRGIYRADVVLVPLEDGDRTEALVNKGKFVITIDLNPLSRTAQMSQITIVDNLVRCIPKMIDYAKELKECTNEELTLILKDFDQKQNLNQSIQIIIKYLKQKQESN